jgi:uncharacterized protein YutE (UPF0331/DUF86 family)
MNWADFAEAGLADAEPFEVRARFESSTDLMEQVQRLLDDGSVHHAAPVVLCGAALEEFLRALATAASPGIGGTPTLDKYATELQKAGVITRQDAKDIRSWAGLRNSAAHGHFDDFSLEQAQLMAQGVNLFMRQKHPS